MCTQKQNIHESSLTLQASSEQIARNIYTLLSQAKPLATLALQRAHAGMDAEEPVSSSSWCGALERESVKPSNMSEGPRQRRKRQKVEAAQVLVTKYSKS